MKWNLLWFRKREEPDLFLKDKQKLLEEVRTAQAEWQNALRRLDYVVGIDQVDYAIYALEAAEKRYEMLLKSAKRMQVNALLHSGTGKVAGG